MKNIITWSLTAAALIAPSLASSQDTPLRMRSNGYEGNAVIACQKWGVPFVFESCERKPLDGSIDNFAQFYTMADGSLRTLTQDPQAPKTPVVTEAVSTTVENVPPQVTSVQVPPVRPPKGVAEAVDVKANASSGTEFVLPSKLVVAAGKAEIVPVAVGHINRIETPFKHPTIKTSAPKSALNVEFDGSFLYLSITQPVTLFIHENGHPDPAIVVSLVPKRIAPRQIAINLPKAELSKIKVSGSSNRSATQHVGVTKKSPRRTYKPVHAETLHSFMKGLRPAGFLNVPIEGYKASDYCSSRIGLKFSFKQGQAIESGTYTLLRGMVESSTDQLLNEVWCAKSGETLAVAFGPKIRVSKNAPVDFFILLRRDNAAIKTVR